MLLYALLISTLAAVEPARRSASGALGTGAKVLGFRETPRNQAALLGGEVTFRCAAEAVDAEYDRQSQWRTNAGILLGYDSNAVTAMSGGRYSYQQESTEQLHLRISNVSLSDDGNFECQMFRREEGPIRSSAQLNVLVPPSDVYFEHYQANSPIEVNEDSPLNVTCVGRNAKPELTIKWFVNGQLITDNIHRWVEYHSNGTSNSYASLFWRPTKAHHQAMLTCEVLHPETKTETRLQLTTHVLYSSERPEIEILNKDKVKVGQNVTLVCTADGGNPPPQLTWYLEDRQMKTQFSYDFNTKITRNEMSLITEGGDNGAIYECRSNNRLNAPTLKTSVAIAVDYPPATVSFVNSSTTVRKGDAVQLACRSSIASPPPVITWLINGAPTSIQPQSEVRRPHGSYTESTITIHTSSLLSDVHQINVDCTATNDEGSAAKQQLVRVLSPPFAPFIHNYGGSPMLEGELLNLTCEAHGGNPLAVLSWYRGLEKLRDAQSTVDGNSSRSTVTIQLDRSMNNQPVRCESINPALDYPLNATMTLSVLYPPRIIEVRPLEGDQEHMIAGHPTRLRCTIPSANPVPEIHWEFRSKDAAKPQQLSGELSLNRTSKEFGGYEVENAVTFVPTVDMDQSEVFCVVSHPLWTVARSKEYRLNVYYAPRIKIESPLNLVLNEGDSFTEDISVIANPLIVQHRWRKNGISFTDGVDAISVRGSTISGRHVTSEDSGTYLLLAANKFGSSNLTIKITVQYGARITHAPSAVFADVGEHVVLECQADGFPRRHGMIRWERSGGTLPSVNQDERRAVLRINASKESAGAYVCVADNGVGAPNFTTSYVLIKSRPVIQRRPGHDRAAGPIKGRARLRCVAQAVPIVGFYWNYESGSEIRHNSSKYTVVERQLDQTTFESVLFVNELNEGDYSRRIRCHAKNALGSDYDFLTIGPLTAPDQPHQVTLAAYNSTSAHITWLPGFDGGSDQFYELHYQSKEDKYPHILNVTGPEITLRDLRPSRAYYAQVRAINAHGRSSELSLPQLAIRTRAENGTDFLAEAVDGITTSNFLLSLLLILLGLLLFNCVLYVVYCKRRRRRMHMEKTEIARRNGGGERRPLQIYGALDGSGGSSGGGGVANNGHSPAAFARRPISRNTNKSELMHELSEDDHSVCTMLQVSPNIVHRQANGGGAYLVDGNYVIDDSFDPSCYSSVNKHTANLLHDSTAITNLSHGSPSIHYADLSSSTLKRGSLDSPRRMGSVTGSLADTHRNYAAMNGASTLPTPHARHLPPQLSTFGAPSLVGHPEGDLV